MRVTVCELPNDAGMFRPAWKKLAEHVRAESSDLVLLPELPFHPWPFVRRAFDRTEWNGLVSAHEEWILKLKELAPATVLGTRQTDVGGRRLNQAFVWTRSVGVKPAHSKHYLPDEDGFWEASWYGRGDNRFLPVKVGAAKIGFLICSEMWSMPEAVSYGRAGVHMIATPRATGRGSVEKWLMGGRACAVVSGAFSISSNRNSELSESASLGGQGWIVEPDGRVLGTTSRDHPFLTVDLDLAVATRAKRTYPRYSIFK